MLGITTFTTALSEAGAKIGTAVREIARSEARGTTWVQRVIYGEIATRAVQRGAAYWDATFPDLSPEARAERRIRRMLTRTGVAGVAAATGASAAEVLSLTTKGAAAPVAIPLGLVSVGAEMLYTTALQIDLAFDLASIYGVPYAGDDVGEIATLLAMSLGVGFSEEPTRHDEPDEAPEATKPWRVVRQMYRSDFAQDVGSKLMQQSFLRDALPVAGILVNAVWSQLLLRRYARGVHMAARHRRAVVRACRRLALGNTPASDVHTARTLLEGAWLLATSCGPLQHESALVLSTLIDALALPERIDVHEPSFRGDQEAWFDKVVDLDTASQDLLVEILVLMAGADGELDVAERRFLQRLSRTLSRPIDLDAAQTYCDELKRGNLPEPVGWPARALSPGTV